MKICLLDPYFTGSHKKWALEYQKFSSHEISLLTLKGRHWKWRMHGGSISLAKMVLNQKEKPDLFLATSMMDTTTFLALTRKEFRNIPLAIYFHENQWSYPLSPKDTDPEYQRDQHYGFIQYASALAADALFFNSSFNLENFLEGTLKFLKNMRDFRELETISTIRKKSIVLPLGLDLKKFDQCKKLSKPQTEKKNSPPLILWNHRWEYDKNPEGFFHTLFKLDKENIDFNLAVLGDNRGGSCPPIFKKAKDYFGDRIVVYGHQKSFEDYAFWLWKSDISFITSHHDFFGISAVEALYCKCLPIYPQKLAYPEHFKNKQDQSLYKNEEQGYKALKKAILEFPFYQSIPSNIAEEYDWSKMAPLYDNEFSNLKKRG